MIPGVQSLAKEVSVVPSPLEPRNRFHALTIEEPEEPSDENVTFEEPEEPSEENFACLRSTTDSQPIEPSKSEVIYSGKSDSLSLNPGTSTMNSETGNGTSVSVPGSPEDSQAVLYLQSKRHVKKRETRWMKTLADFHFTLHHVPGKANMADPLTRQDRVFAQTNSIEFSVDLELDDNEELSAGYENDSELADIIRRLTSTRQDTLHEHYIWNELSQRLHLTMSD